MIGLQVSSVFDGDGDGDLCTIATTRAFARAILDALSGTVYWLDDTGETVPETDEMRETIEAGIESATAALNP